MARSIVCASPSYRVDIESNIEAAGQNATGNWREDTRHVSGELTGTIEQGRFEGAVTRTRLHGECFATIERTPSKRENHARRGPTSLT